MGFIILGEQIFKKDIICAFIGFSGVIFIAKPDFLIEFFEDKIDTELKVVNEFKLIGVLCGLGSGFFQACNNILFAYLGGRYNPIVLVHWSYVYAGIIFGFF